MPKCDPTTDVRHVALGIAGGGQRHWSPTSVAGNVRVVNVRAVTEDDLDWVVAVLAERRKLLVPHAPIFWHPSQDADRIHRAYLARLLTQAGAKGYRTDKAVLIAAPSRAGWIVDDARIPSEQWSTPDADTLWRAFTTDCSGDPVRFVCP